MPICCGPSATTVCKPVKCPSPFSHLVGLVLSVTVSSMWLAFGGFTTVSSHAQYQNLDDSDWGLTTDNGSLTLIRSRPW